MVKGLLSTAVFLMVLGGAFAGGGWLGLAQTQPFDDGIETTAQIIGVSPGTTLIDGRVVRTEAPIYQFEAVDGQTYVVTDHVSSANRVTVGSTAEISYRPDDPGDVRRTDISYSWLWIFVVAGGMVASSGALALLAAGWVAVARRRQRPSGPAAGFAPGFRVQELR